MTTTASKTRTKTTAVKKLPSNSMSGSPVGNTGVFAKPKVNQNNASGGQAKSSAILAKVPVTRPALLKSIQDSVTKLADTAKPATIPHSFYGREALKKAGYTLSTKKLELKAGKKDYFDLLNGLMTAVRSPAEFELTLRGNLAGNERISEVFTSNVRRLLQLLPTNDVTRAMTPHTTRVINLALDAENGGFTVKLASNDRIKKRMTVTTVTVALANGFNDIYLTATRNRGVTLDKLIERRLAL